MKAQRALVVLIFFLLTLFPVIARADENGNKFWDTLKPDFISTRFFFGQQINYDHWEKEDWDYKIYGFNFGSGYFIGEEKKWRIKLDVIYRHFTAYNEDYRVRANTFGLGLSVERSFCLYKNLDFILGIQGDISYLREKKDQPHWGNSGVIGSFGVYLGLEMQIYDNIKLRALICPLHSSDPRTKKEFGRNFMRETVELIIVF